MRDYSSRQTYLTLHELNLTLLVFPRSLVWKVFFKNYNLYTFLGAVFILRMARIRGDRSYKCQRPYKCQTLELPNAIILSFLCPKTIFKLNICLQRLSHISFKTTLNHAGNQIANIESSCTLGSLHI